jgi:hypothetical protein
MLSLEAFSTPEAKASVVTLPSWSPRSRIDRVRQE